MSMARSRRPRLAVLLTALAAGALLAGGDARASSWSELSRDYQTHLRGEAAREGGAPRRWPDNSPGAIAARKAALEGFKSRLDAIPPASLSSDDAVSRAFLDRQVGLALESIAFDEARMPFQTRAGFHQRPENEAKTVVLRSESEARAWIDHIGAIPDYYAIETENMRRGIRTGFTQPAIVVQVVLKSISGLAAEPAAESTLLKPLTTLPGTMPAERKAALLKAGERVVASKVRPAQVRLATFLREEYMPKARPALGASSLKDGGRYYALQVRRHTTTNLSPEDIHRIGEAEVARIRAEMDTAIAETGFKGDLKAFLASIVADPRFQADSALSYAQHAGEIAKRVDFLLPRYFGKLPRLPYGVRTTEGDPTNELYGGYQRGSPEAGVAGAAVYPPGRRGPLYSLPAWLVHEGAPGHHLQIALSQENTDLPDFRRGEGITAFTEGWGLYAERLGGEMGIYRDAYERFGQLSMEMWRACRLVMDTGLHAKGWTRDQAAQCMKDNTAMSPAAIYGEVDRYIGFPGQALSYKIGELRIVALRKRAEASLGDRFDLREFHDAVLGQGALPLDLLEQQIDAWILKKSSAAPARPPPAS